MTNTNIATAVRATGATKYRIATREVVTAQGWVLDQIEAGIDRFTKDGEVIELTHGGKDTMTASEKFTGDANNDVIRDGKQKLERALRDHFGIDMGTRWVLSAADEAKLPPLGVGNGLIKPASAFVTTSTPEEEEPANEPVAETPAPKPAARSRAKGKAPVEKLSPR